MIRSLTADYRRRSIASRDKVFIENFLSSFRRQALLLVPFFRIEGQSARFHNIVSIPSFFPITIKAVDRQESNNALLLVSHFSQAPYYACGRPSADRGLIKNDGCPLLSCTSC